MTIQDNSQTLTDANGADSRSLRRIAEQWVSDLLHTGDEVDLRRESRRVFEDSCLDETLWESFIDEWRDVVLELAGHNISHCEFYALTDWCKCGHSHDDHGLDCQHCDCERFDRSRAAKRPKQRQASKWASEQRVLKRELVAALSARECRRVSNLVGEDLTGGAL